MAPLASVPMRPSRRMATPPSRLLTGGRALTATLAQMTRRLLPLAVAARRLLPAMAAQRRRTWRRLWRHVRLPTRGGRPLALAQGPPSARGARSARQVTRAPLWRLVPAHRPHPALTPLPLGLRQMPALVRTAQTLRRPVTALRPCWQPTWLLATTAAVLLAHAGRISVCWRVLTWGAQADWRSPSGSLQRRTVGEGTAQL